MASQVKRTLPYVPYAAVVAINIVIYSANVLAG